MVNKNNLVVKSGMTKQNSNSLVQYVIVAKVYPTVIIQVNK